jgi:predicted CXXCH cytochrome family protein
MRSVAKLASLLVMAIVLLPLGTAVAGAREPAWLPKPPRGRGEKCVADTAWMRRNHMTALIHHRQDAVHEGIRTKRFSLTGCVDCHAVKGADGKPVTFASPKHFCRVCHDYAAVSIDCFECHASTPEPKAAASGEAAPEHASRADAAVLKHYLGSLKP